MWAIKTIKIFYSVLVSSDIFIVVLIELLVVKLKFCSLNPSEKYLITIRVQYHLCQNFEPRHKTIITFAVAPCSTGKPSSRTAMLGVLGTFNRVSNDLRSPSFATCWMVSEQVLLSYRCSLSFSQYLTGRDRAGLSGLLRCAAGKQISYHPCDPCWNWSKLMAMVSDFKAHVEEEMT